MKILSLLFSLLFCLSAVGGEYAFEFIEAAVMPGATAGHSAVGLANGDVLVVGGLGKLFGIPLAVNLGRVYEVEHDRWRVLKSQMRYGRIGAGVVRLGDGKVVIAGGLSQGLTSLKLVEVYDPKREEFSVVGSMAVARARPRLNLLDDGRVLISGDSRMCELLEPVEDGYRLRTLEVRTLGYHSDHVAVNLGDGSVVLIGGRSKGVERFDPVSEAFFRCSVRLGEVMDDVAAVGLADERLLLAGGQKVYSMVSVGWTRIYDWQRDELRNGPSLWPSLRGKAVAGAADVVAVDLYEGNPGKRGRFILLCGGECDPGKGGLGKDVVLDFAKVYDAENNILIDVGPMRHERDDFAGVLLPQRDGESRVLLMGGYAAGDRVQGTCEIFRWRVKKK